MYTTVIYLSDMSKRCIKGVICVENITLLLFFILGLLVFLFYRLGGRQDTPNTDANSPHSSLLMQPMQSLQSLQPKPNTFYTSDSADVLTNPYAPPLKDNMLISGRGGTVMGSGAAGAPDSTRGIPINVATSSAINTGYRQTGILTKANQASNNANGSNANNDSPVILPLMGRPLFTSRDKWMFYTISDKNNSMKLPIIIKGRNALSEIGVDNVYDGDTVYVQGYNETFRVTLYENSTPQYIPFL
jgi:hypothetical protein